MTGKTDGRRRVVVTGLGAVTPLALAVRASWEAALAGRSGVSLIEQMDASGFTSRLAGEVTGFDPTTVLPKREVRRMDRFAQLGLAAADEAIKDSGLDLDSEDRTRAGALIGSGIGGIAEIEAQMTRFLEKGPGQVSPFLIMKMMPNAAGALAAIRWGLKGPNFSVSSACASGAHALGEALRMIRFGGADVMLAGGSEAPITFLGLGGFCSMKALSTRNDAPKAANRPFDRDRDGFVIAEGAGVVVLEELERARRRGAKIYAEFAGYGATDDAYHMTAPDAEGAGAAAAMRLALADARLAPADVDYVNAHGTSTKYNDRTETAAIKAALGETDARRVAVSSTKSMTGHTLGASGAIEFILTALAVQEGAVPPTINYTTLDPECDLDYVPKEARRIEVRAALSNSLGFGGHNASLALTRFTG